MGLSTIQLREELRQHLGLDSTDVDYDDDWCDVLLNRSFWEIQDKFAFKEKEASTNLVYPEGTYSLALSPSILEALRVVSVFDPVSAESIPLDRWTDYQFQNGTIFDSNYSTGIPENFYRQNRTLFIYPIPDQAYTIKLIYQATLDDLTSSSNPSIPQSWHEIILFGGVWRGFAKLSDMDQMKQFRSLQADLINSSVPVESKEEINLQHAGVYVYGYDDREL